MGRLDLADVYRDENLPADFDLLEQRDREHVLQAHDVNVHVNSPLGLLRRQTNREYGAHAPHSR